MNNAPSCSVLVVSCDGYRDLWKPFFALFWRYWPDCRYPVYLAANFAAFEDTRVLAIQTGRDETWSRHVRRALERIESDYVLLLLEDFFLNRGIANAKIFDLLNALHRLGGTMLRLNPKPGPDERLAGMKTLGRVHRFAPYRVSAQPAIWNRRDLLALLRGNESPWEFESNGTLRSQSTADGYYATYSPVISYRHVVERGVWFWTAAAHYKRQNIGCDFTARPVMGIFTALKKVAGRWRRRLLHHLLPSRFRTQALAARQQHFLYRWL